MVQLPVPAARLEIEQRKPLCSRRVALRSSQVAHLAGHGRSEPLTPTGQLPSWLPRDRLGKTDVRPPVLGHPPPAGPELSGARSGGSARCVAPVAARSRARSSAIGHRQRAVINVGRWREQVHERELARDQAPFARSYGIAISPCRPLLPAARHSGDTSTRSIHCPTRRRVCAEAGSDGHPAGSHTGAHPQARPSR